MKRILLLIITISVLGLGGSQTVEAQLSPIQPTTITTIHLNPYTVRSLD